MLDRLASLVRAFFFGEPRLWAIVHLTGGATLYGLVQRPEGPVVRLWSFDPATERLVKSVSVIGGFIEQIEFRAEDEVRDAFVRAHVRAGLRAPCADFAASWVLPERCKFCAGTAAAHERKKARVARLAYATQVIACDVGTRPEDVRLYTEGDGLYVGEGVIANVSVLAPSAEGILWRALTLAEWKRVHARGVAMGAYPGDLPS